ILWDRRPIPKAGPKPAPIAYARLVVNNAGACGRAKRKRGVMESASVALLVYAQLRPRLALCPWWLREAGEGLCFTLLIAVTMSMPLMLPGDVRIDLRTTLVCLSVVFGGPLCGAIAAIGGLALRQAMGGPASAAGMMLVVFPYVMTIAYVKAAARWRHKIGYGDLVAIGVLLDLLRLGVWLIAFGYAFTLASMNLIWFGVCALVVVN